MHAFRPYEEIFFRVNEDSEPHVSVGDAAEFSALTVKFSDLSSGHPHIVFMQRNHVYLAGDLWYPETVNDVLGFKLERNRAIYWDMQFV